MSWFRPRSGSGRPVDYREARGWVILGWVATAGAGIGCLGVLFGILVIVAVLVWG